MKAAVVTVWAPRRPRVGGALAYMPGWERSGQGWCWVGPRSEAAAPFCAAMQDAQSACGPCASGAPYPEAYWGDLRAARHGSGPWGSDPRTDWPLQRELLAEGEPVGWSSPRIRQIYLGQVGQ